MGDVWNVLNIAMPEAQAVQGFEQVAAGADALDGGLEDVLGVGLGVDDHWRAVGDAAVERVIAVWERIWCKHIDYSIVSKVTRQHRDQTMGGGPCTGLVNREQSTQLARRRPAHGHHSNALHGQRTPRCK